VQKTPWEPMPPVLKPAWSAPPAASATTALCLSNKTPLSLSLKRTRKTLPQLCKVPVFDQMSSTSNRLLNHKSSKSQAPSPTNRKTLQISQGLSRSYLLTTTTTTKETSRRRREYTTEKTEDLPLCLFASLPPNTQPKEAPPCRKRRDLGPRSRAESGPHFRVMSSSFRKRIEFFLLGESRLTCWFFEWTV
jgi:hypothetical protein